MASTTFTDKDTVISADWANDVDALVYDVFQAASTVADARTNLGVKNAAGSDVKDIADIAPGDGVFLVGDGTNWISESGTTAASSLGALVGDLAGLSDPGGDRFLIWDDSAGTVAFASAGSGLSFDTTPDVNVSAVLADLDSLGAATADGQFIVATGAGVFAYESGSTVRDSLGLGTGDTANFSTVQQGGNRLGWEVLDNGTVSAAASLDITGLTSSYRAYMLVFDNLQLATDGADLLVRTSTDNGASFDAGASDYDELSFTNVTTATGTSSSLQLNSGDTTAKDFGNAAGETAAGHIIVSNPTDSASRTVVQSEITHTASNGALAHTWGGGHRDAAEANDAFQILPSGGNISTMNWTLYGLRAS